MKTILILSMAGALITANPTSTPQKTVNVQESTINWTGHKVLGSHTGEISLKEGQLTFDNGILTGGSFVMDMTSITCTDLDAETGAKLIGHLSSDDFFGVSNHPYSKLVIKRAIPYGKEGEYKIIADITIKETTEEITFFANVEENRASANLQIDRSKFDIKYGSGSFFDGLGDKTIYDEFDLEVNLVLE